jgi:hypothetical protein
VKRPGRRIVDSLTRGAGIKISVRINEKEKSQRSEIRRFDGKKLRMVVSGPSPSAPSMPQPAT